MKNRSNLRSLGLLLGLSLTVFFSACDKDDDDPQIGDPPTEADAAFTYTTSSTSDNIIVFTASNPNLDATWDLGNGSNASGSEVEGTYPFAGTYTVTLTVQNSGGTAFSSQDIVIAEDDPSLIDNPIYTLLTDDSEKTWVVDSISAAHFGVGPAPANSEFDGYYPKWYAASSLEKSGSGMYDDRYVFDIQGFGFDMYTNGDVYVNTEHAGTPPFDDTTASNVGDFTALFPDQLDETWTLTETATDTTIELSGDAMIAYWTGVQTYRVITLEENKMVLAFEDAANADLLWYITLIPEGFVRTPPDPDPEYSLPLTFENQDPEFNVFGNSTYAIINNPDPSGINTSNRVLETVHGNETWAGLSVALDAPLDFSTENTITLKVWAPSTGDFRLKLEEQDDANSFVELDVQVTTANTWEELTFDLTGTPNIYDRLVMFPGWNVANAGTFYIDDIDQQ